MAVTVSTSVRLAVAALAGLSLADLKGKRRRKVLAELRESLDSLILYFAAFTDETGDDLGYTLESAAARLGIRPSALSSWLRRHRWVCERHDRLHALRPKVDAGLLVNTDDWDGEGEYPEPGSLTERLVITPKGLAAIAVARGQAVTE